MTEDMFTAVTSVESIREKSFATFEIGGVSIAICRFRDEFFAVENLCSHALSTFEDGRMRGYRIMCPLHGATFDIRNGDCTGAPASKPIRSFPTRIIDDTIEVELPAKS
jgi:3-phenylpropionate/trans-cinnamate dioxygenase ferredoxin subunit